MNSIICVLCKRDINVIGQDNMSPKCDTPICEDCFNDLLNEKALNSKYRINDLVEFKTEIASFEELAKQNSYFMNSSKSCRS